MAKHTWTPNQEKAIYTKGSDLLVSAAAGSGKTAVLTERIIEKLLDPTENLDITDFLIVTFTVSATSELREKLSSALSQKYAENRSQKKLRRQLLKLPSAKILTIDAFCKYVVNECSEALSLPSDMTLGDEGELSAIVDEAINEITDECFEGEVYGEFSDKSFLPENTRSGFLSLIETFSTSKGYDSLTTTLTELYNILLTYPEPFSRMKLILKKYTDTLRLHYAENSDVSFFDTHIGKIIKNEFIEGIRVALTLFEAARDEMISRDTMASKYADAINFDIASMTRVLSASSMSDAINELSEYDPKSLTSFKPSREDEVRAQLRFKRYREDAKDIVKKLKGKYPISDSKTLFSHIADTYSICCELFSLLQKIHERIMEKKLEKRILSFDDVAHFAYKALVVEGSYNHETREFKKTDYALSMGEKFNEILIDEYQDVNELQDTIFRAVSNSHNRFMVGDVKQSIYKFRGASPEIFMEYRNTFTPVYEERECFTPTLVSLQNNFRSDNSIINFVNGVFEVIMNYRSEDVYRKDDHLVFSKAEDRGLETEVCIFNETGELDFIADKILSLTGSGEFSFSDICILSRKHDSLAKIQEALSSRLIPSDYTPNKNFFESYEIATILSILRACDNPSDDIPLLSVLTSPIFHFTPSDLLTVRRGHFDTDIYFAVEDYANVGAASDLKERCSDALRRLKGWREASRRLSSESFIWHIYQDTHLLGIASTLSGAEERRENLIAFYDIARNYEKSEFRGVTKFLSFVDNIITQKRHSGTKESSNCVHVTTVHDSKGLEFPVCFFCDADSLISRQDERKKIIMSESFGPAFAIPVGKLGAKVTTYAEKAAIAETRAATADEELRLLYVALTRAKYKLIITADTKIENLISYIKSANVNRDTFSYFIKNAPTMLKMLATGLMNEPIFKEAIEAFSNKDLEASSNGLKVQLFEEYKSKSLMNVPVVTEKCSQKEELTAKEIDFAMREASDPILNDTPFKISVSEIREGLLDESDVKSSGIRRYPEFMGLDTSNLSAFTGTAMHTFMQFCDFENCVKNTTVKEAERLLKYGFITDEQVNVLNHKTLGEFFKSKIYKEISKSRKVEREKRYTILMPSSEFFADSAKKEYLDKASKKTLIQGVIDCYYMNDDGSYTIVDFKTDSVNKKDGENILKERHARQLNLYKKSVEEIEGVAVSHLYIYSFCLSKEIEICENDN